MYVYIWIEKLLFLIAEHDSFLISLFQRGTHDTEQLVKVFPLHRWEAPQSEEHSAAWGVIPRQPSQAAHSFLHPFHLRSKGGKQQSRGSASLTSSVDQYWRTTTVGFSNLKASMQVRNIQTHNMKKDTQG